MKRAYIFLTITLALFSCHNAKTDNKSGDSSIASGTVQLISSESFKKLIYNYDENKQWKYEGNMPAIVDFYADWCPPCRQLSPLVEELSAKYQGQIAFYKINTDTEKGLAQSLGISSLPTLLYIPVNGQPQVTLGFIPKEKIIKTIQEILLTK
jgi:thioredoxin 1